MFLPNPTSGHYFPQNALFFDHPFTKLEISAILPRQTGRYRSGQIPPVAGPRQRETTAGRGRLVSKYVFCLHFIQQESWEILHWINGKYRQSIEIS